jgi:hypothetical protein
MCQRCLPSKPIRSKVYIDQGLTASRLENCPSCFVVSFCDGFWKQKPFLEIVQGHWSEDNINDPALVSREQAVLHELMHVDLIGTDWHGEFNVPSFNRYQEQSLTKTIVEDVADKVYDYDKDNRSIYGATICADYAWKFMGGRQVNPRAPRNADNFAWAAFYDYMSDTWGWGIGSKRSVTEFGKEPYVRRELSELERREIGNFKSIGGCTLT